MTITPQHRRVAYLVHLTAGCLEAVSRETGIHMQVLVAWMRDDDFMLAVDACSGARKVHNAIEWLLATLHDGPVEAFPLHVQARLSGINRRSLYEARRDLGIIIYTSKDDIWWWALP